MKALLRNKQVYWPHFITGIYMIFFGGVMWFLVKEMGIFIIGYGLLGWSIPELLMGGDENDLKGESKEDGR